ncbi:MAG: HAD-IA family hydrolase [Isosphaeraceae bacterium]
MSQTTSQTQGPASTSSGRLRGVIFDMDGVLVMSEPILAQAAGRMFAEKGFTVVHEEFRPFIGMGEDRYIGGVAEARGIPIDPEKDKARTYELYLELIRGKLGPLPGVLAFVAGCRARGYKTAVASSADLVKVRGNLHEIGLPYESFDVVIDGTMVARKKPAPDIFLEACRRLELDPSVCLVVEDAVSGVAAAKAAGTRCLAVTTSFGPEHLTKADWVVAGLDQVPDEVLGW